MIMMMINLFKPKGRRHIGRPRKRWRDQFHFEGTRKRNQTESFLNMMMMMMMMMKCFIRQELWKLLVYECYLQFYCVEEMFLKVERFCSRGKNSLYHAVCCKCIDVVRFYMHSRSVDLYTLLSGSTKTFICSTNVQFYIQGVPGGRDKISGECSLC